MGSEALAKCYNVHHRLLRRLWRVRSCGELQRGYDHRVGHSETAKCTAARADSARASRQRRIQSIDAFAAAEPCAGLGSADADDHCEACQAVKAESLERRSIGLWLSSRRDH